MRKLDIFALEPFLHRLFIQVQVLQAKSLRDVNHIWWKIQLRSHEVEILFLLTEQSASLQTEHLICESVANPYEFLGDQQTHDKSAAPVMLSQELSHILAARLHEVGIFNLRFLSIDTSLSSSYIFV